MIAFAPGLAAQSQSPTALQETGFTLYETFEGSGNSDGLVTDLNSTVGYRFSKHFGVDVGVPGYFIRAASSKPGTSSSNQMGNPCADLRWMFKNPSVNDSSTLNGAVPTAEMPKTTTACANTTSVAYQHDFLIESPSQFAPELSTPPMINVLAQKFDGVAEGSSIRICDPPGPGMISLRNRRRGGARAQARRSFTSN